ncbi:unnamed protein product [Plutella xylostella]|uniref:(diamondback moth) hypothetical protein n=1 Tax=Plutella xylostella TaxID=51655 RepID=A0A8S4GAB6_PLUXY|nr:unnamed protein product [Plutella xylostella]
MREEKEIYDFVSPEKEADSPADRSPIQFWNLVNKAGLEGKFKDNMIVPQISGSSTNELPTISMFETPPPPSPSVLYTTDNSMEISKPVTMSHYEKLFSMAHITDKATSEDTLAVETPPPPQKNKEVYGQWNGKKFSHNVLSYLKSIKFGNRDPPKIPATIPLTKISDSLPYASTFSVRKKVVPLTFPRNNFKILKRSIKEPRAINVQILEDDWKEAIRKHHASTRPMKVEITNRGINEKSGWNRYNRDVHVRRTKQNKKKTRKGANMTKGVNAKRNAKISTKHGLETTKLGSILPFLKSLEYFIVSNETVDTKKDTQSHNHKWHNIKSFNDNHQARAINMSVIQYTPNIQNNKSLELHDLKELSTKKPRHKKQKKRKSKNRLRNKSNKATHALSSSTTTVNSLRTNDNTFSTYLSDSLPKGAGTTERIIKPVKSVGFFNRTIKIGNALNELPVLGLNDVNKKNSFFGGDEKVPDIDRYRSDSEESKPEYVPPSLTSTVCKATERQHERLLSNSFADSEIPMYKGVNLAFEFIIIMQKKCTIDQSTPDKIIDLLLIDWDITPVNLFGGAYPVKTIDLCGFF